MSPYPFTYFSNLLIARKMFSGRHSLKVWQQLLTTLFLISLLLIPTVLEIARLDTYPLDNIVSGVYDPLTEEVMTDLQTVKITDGQLSYEGQPHPQVYFGETVQETKGFSYQFTASQLVIRNEQNVLAELPYQYFSTADFASKETLTQAISRAWFTENRMMASVLLIGVSSILVGFNVLFLVLGASFILYLTKRTPYFDFQTFSECYTFTLNCLGLPTILACLLGIFGQPVLTVIMAQNMLFVLMLIWVFYKTQFRDLS